MENILHDDASMLELQVDDYTAESLESASWWSRFSAIVISILLALVLLVVLFVMNSSLRYSMGASFDLDPSAGALIWILLFFVFGFCGVMITLMLVFAAKTRNGVRQVNQDLLERGFNALKIYFILYGIVSILGVLGNLLTLVK